MQNATITAIVLIAAYALSTGATAQNIYKCGSSYSQSPCPGGSTIDVTDARTPAQKEQTDSAVSRDAQTAEAMQKARIQQEKTDLAANTPTSASNTPFWATESSMPASGVSTAGVKPKTNKAHKATPKIANGETLKKTEKKKTLAKPHKALDSASKQKKLPHHPTIKTAP